MIPQTPPSSHMQLPSEGEHLQMALAIPQAHEGEHPSRARWDAYRLACCDPAEQTALDAHLATCALCQETLAELREESRAFVAAPQFEANLAALLQAAEASTPRRPQVATSSWRVRLAGWWRAPMWASVGAAAALLLFLVGPLQKFGTTPSSTLRPIGVKGSPEVHVFLERGQGWSKLDSKVKASFQANDQLAFKYKSGGYRYLYMVLRDHKGALSWLYHGMDNRSLPIANQGELQGSITLDAAQGQEQLLTFFSLRPLTRAQVQAYVQNPASLPKTSSSSTQATPVFLHRFLIRKTSR